MTTIYYVRHGQTDYNKQVLMYGAIDADINATGIEQAKQTGIMLKDIKFDKIYCSSMKRAQETCHYINEYHNLPVILDNRLVERGYGDLEGKPESIIPNVKEWKADGWSFVKNIHYDNNVENITDCYNRVSAALKDIVAASPNQTVLIVAHRGVGRMTKAYFDGIPADGSVIPYQISNAEYWKFIVE